MNKYSSFYYLFPIDKLIKYRMHSCCYSVHVAWRGFWSCWCAAVCQCAIADRSAWRVPIHCSRCFISATLRQFYLSPDAWKHYNGPLLDQVFIIHNLRYRQELGARNTFFHQTNCSSHNIYIFNQILRISGSWLILWNIFIHKLSMLSAAACNPTLLYGYRCLSSDRSSMKESMQT